MYGNMMAPPKMVPAGVTGAPMYGNRNNSLLLPTALLACLLFMALILAIVATVVPDWAHGDVTFNTTPPLEEQRKVGLWELCGQVSSTNLVYSDDCEDMLDFVKDNCPDNEDNMKFLQAMAVLTCIFFALALIILACGAWLSHFLGTALGLFLLFLGLLCGVIVVIAFVDQILQEDWPCMDPASLNDVPEGTLGIAWTLMLLAVVLAFLAFLLGAYILYQLYQKRQRNMYYGNSPVYSPMYTPPLSPVGDYRSYSPAAVSPPPVPIVVPAAAGTLEDPLLARVEAVKGRLRRTLADDAGRILTGTPPPPPVQVYVPPRPFSFY